MIVCLCRGVPDQTVQRAISSGATTVEALARACGAGTDCGACVRALAGLIHDAGRGAGAGSERA